jgi:hypothetical protein
MKPLFVDGELLQCQGVVRLFAVQEMHDEQELQLLQFRKLATLCEKDHFLDVDGGRNLG